MSERVMYIDTAGTRRFLFGEPITSPEQPHLCRLCLLIEEDRLQVLSASYLVKPTDKWRWDDEQTERHSVHPGEAEALGQPVNEVWEHFWPLLEGVDTVVAFNMQFHWKMVERLSLAATGEVLGAEHAFIPVPPPQARYKCAMRASVSLVGKRVNGRLLNPTLSEAYRHFTGRSLDKVRHARFNGMAHCTAVREIWHGIEDHKEMRYG